MGNQGKLVTAGLPQSVCSGKLYPWPLPPLVPVPLALLQNTASPHVAGTEALSMSLMGPCYELSTSSCWTHFINTQSVLPSCQENSLRLHVPQWPCWDVVRTPAASACMPGSWSCALHTLLRNFAHAPVGPGSTRHSMQELRGAADVAAVQFTLSAMRNPPCFARPWHPPWFGHHLPAPLPTNPSERVHMPSNFLQKASRGPPPCDGFMLGSQTKWCPAPSPTRASLPHFTPVVCRSVLEVLLCCFWVGWAGAVGVREQALDRRQQRADVVAGGPLVLQQVHAQGAIRVHCTHNNL